MGDVSQNESRARRKIREAAERYGLTVLWASWTPIGAGAEMSGASGGWEVGFGDDDLIDYALGYSWPGVIESIDSQVAEARLRDGER